MDTRNPGEAESAMTGSRPAGNGTPASESQTDESLTGAARDAARRASAEARHQKDRAVGEMDGMTQSMRHAADTLRQDRQAWLASLVESGADELGTFSDMLRSNDLQGVLSRVEAFARRQPALFAGASMAAGFALARVARVAAMQQGASSHRNGDDQTGQDQASAKTAYGTSYHG